MRNTRGITTLLMQYFKNGFEVVARNRKWRLNKINVVMFQLIINTPMAIPTNKAASGLTLPRYSGARYRESAPKVFMKVPFTVLNSTNQKISSTWNFLKCSMTNCTGNE
jgi:hypothetical protein